jgi:phosphoserine phosphatase
LEVDAGGRLTGRFDGGNCRGAKKLSGLVEWMEASSSAAHAGEGAHVGERPYLWAYGNSAGDFEMLEAADVGVDAGRLGKLGKLRQFRRLGDVLTAW